MVGASALRGAAAAAAVRVTGSLDSVPRLEIATLNQADADLEACRTQISKDVTALLLRSLTSGSQLSPQAGRRMAAVFRKQFLLLENEVQEECDRKMLALTAECDLETKKKTESQCQREMLAMEEAEELLKRASERVSRVPGAGAPHCPRRSSSTHSPTHPGVHPPSIHPPSAHLSIPPPIHRPSTHPTMHPSTNSPCVIQLPNHDSIHPSIHSPTHTPIHPLTLLSIYLSKHLLTHPCFHPSIHPSAHHLSTHLEFIWQAFIDHLLSFRH